MKKASKLGKENMKEAGKKRTKILRNIKCELKALTLGRIESILYAH